MPAFHESEYVMHPATLDAVFQAMMVAACRLDTVEKQVWVPTGVAYMFISSGINHKYGGELQGLAESSISGVREMKANALIGDNQELDSLPRLIIDDFMFTGLGRTQSPPQLSDVLSSKLFAVPVWAPDLDLVDSQMLRSMSRCVDEHHGDRDGVDAGMRQFCAMADILIKQMCRLALSKLEPSIINPSLPAHLLKYAEWMRKRCDYRRTGIGTPPQSVGSGSVESALPEMPDIHGFIERYPVDGRLTLHVYQTLGSIFNQERTAIDVIHEDNLLDQAYQDVYGLRLNVELTKTWFKLKAHKQPALRVIEIGAGTASSTVPLLQTLSQDWANTPLISWTFTDISAGWFENAKNLLRDWKGRMEYKVLNMDSDPVEQGFKAGSYDVVLAVNVSFSLPPLSSSEDIAILSWYTRHVAEHCLPYRCFMQPKISTRPCSAAIRCSSLEATSCWENTPTPMTCATLSLESCLDGGQPRTTGKTGRCFDRLNGTSPS